MCIKLNCIVAACEGGGIGCKGNLPWKLKKEMGYFSRTTSSVNDDLKRNAVIMGRKTWESIPLKYRPLSRRLNIVLSKTLTKVDNDGVVVCESLEKAVSVLKLPIYQDVIETVWIIGGAAVYEAAINSPWCHRIYFTDIKMKYECDVFFPPIPKNFVRINDEKVPDDIQEENGVKYQFQLFEKTSSE